MKSKCLGESTGYGHFGAFERPLMMNTFSMRFRILVC